MGPSTRPIPKPWSAKYELSLDNLNHSNEGPILTFIIGKGNSKEGDDRDVDLLLVCSKNHPTRHPVIAKHAVIAWHSRSG